MSVPRSAQDVHRYEPHTRQPVHAHDVLHLSLVLQGAVTERVRGNEFTAGPLQVLLKAPGLRHADEYGPVGAQIYRLVLEPEFVRSLEEDEDGDPLPDWKWFDPGPATKAMLGLFRSSPAEYEAALQDVLAALRPWRSSPRGQPPRWLQAAREQIRETTDPALSIAKLAAQAGVHPVHLARCFRHWFGRSARSLLQAARLRRAAGLIASDHPFAHVAMDSGFSDQAHLSRSFRSHLDTTPSEYREMVR